MSRIADVNRASDNLVTNPLSGPGSPLHLNQKALGRNLEKIERAGVSFASYKIDLNLTTPAAASRSRRCT
ncbi:hypothetical protein [Lysobacter firmicutimachus]|uniref:Uncharacterized protein n=1 Tax=Lysobacter firmicutimachus TaxID=1792846 RepID=A0ABU8D1Q6_9GAMM